MLGRNLRAVMSATSAISNCPFELKTLPKFPRAKIRRKKIVKIPRENEKERYLLEG